MHDALGRHCQDHLLGTVDNGPANAYSFALHPVFPAGPLRYLPGYGFQSALDLARRFEATHIFCEHPYMAPLAIRLSRRLGLPWALRCHNIEADRFRQLGKKWWPLLRRFERFAMRHADLIFFITPEDRERAISCYGLNAQQCKLAPYGTPLQQAPHPVPDAKTKLATELHLNPRIPWLYFLGVQSYAPNAEAVGYIIHEIYPRLKNEGMNCEILIAGKGIREELMQQIEATNGGIRALGFVDDLVTFLNACDVMMNPMLSGGGIKTKAVEALAYNKMLVSTENGAAGLLPKACGNNLLITPDGDWDAFSKSIGVAVQKPSIIPDAFYKTYNWDAIAATVLSALTTKRPASRS